MLVGGDPEGCVSSVETGRCGAKKEARTCEEGAILEAICCATLSLCRDDHMRSSVQARARPSGCGDAEVYIEYLGTSSKRNRPEGANEPSRFRSDDIRGFQSYCKHDAALGDMRER